MILSAQSIISSGLIEPCHNRSEAFGMTYGVGPAGYDVRVEFDPDGAISGMHIPPGGFILAATMERFQMSSKIIGFVHDKSSWARRGLAVQNTVIEPGWCGYLTLELTNHSGSEIILKRGMPIAQVVFQWLDSDTISPYSGKYQDQTRGPQEAR